MDAITHKGVVTCVETDAVKVEIVRSSACGGCHAKELCGMGEKDRKIVEVPVNPFEAYAVGEEVELVMKPSMGMKAVAVSYVIPLLILVATVVVMSQCGADELLTGLSAIAAVALYYLVIFCFRKRLKNKFEFIITGNINSTL